MREMNEEQSGLMHEACSYLNVCMACRKLLVRCAGLSLCSKVCICRVAQAAALGC